MRTTLDLTKAERLLGDYQSITSKMESEKIRDIQNLLLAFKPFLVSRRQEEMETAPGTTR